MNFLSLSPQFPEQGGQNSTGAHPHWYGVSMAVAPMAEAIPHPLRIMQTFEDLGPIEQSVELAAEAPKKESPGYQKYRTGWERMGQAQKGTEKPTIFLTS